MTRSLIELIRSTPAALGGGPSVTLCLTEENAALCRALDTLLDARCPNRWNVLFLLCCHWYRRLLGVGHWVSDEMGNRGSDGDGVWLSVSCPVPGHMAQVHGCCAWCASLVAEVSVKFGVSSSRMMEAMLANMVRGPGQLRYGCAQFEGSYFVQVMRGAS